MGNAKKKAFTKYADKYKEAPTSKGSIERAVDRVRKYCSVVRVLCATQIRKLGFRQNKNHIMEIQINGGDDDAKIKWAREHFEQEIKVGDVFADNEVIDVIGVTRGTDARDSRENLTEVSERSDVSEPGIPLPLSGLLDVVVVWVTTLEPKSTRRSTELLPVPSEVLPTTLPPKPMPSRRTSPLWVDSLTTEKLTKISSSSRVELWDLARDLSLSESPSSPPPRPG